MEKEVKMKNLFKTTSDEYDTKQRRFKNKQNQ